MSLLQCIAFQVSSGQHSSARLATSLTLCQSSYAWSYTWSILMHTGQFLDAIAYLAPTHLSIYLPSTYLPIHLSSTYLCEPEVNLQEPSGFDLQEPEPGTHSCRFSLNLASIFSGV